ncbi:arylesterase [uncultured Brevundimonas sp.]|uniref:arylesterase n=1 Tax=uncultured Brevundimonas sp. TaxID=213418 RepID=UPI0025FBBC8A|nr:arylesterase [uncultured Brevundimonas sp.]
MTLLGDSISAGFGLPVASALPVRLEAAISSLGMRVRVFGAGVSGDTTADGLRRMARDVPAETRLCVVALGANDLMQMVRPADMAQSLDAIIERLKVRNIDVLLCGMRAPPWVGAYGQAFETVFGQAAQRHGVAFYPFLLEGMALNPALTLLDRLHPNAAGIDVIARGLAPAVVAALGRAAVPGIRKASACGPIYSPGPPGT